MSRQRSTRSIWRKAAFAALLAIAGSPARAQGVDQGRELFEHVWQPNDPRAGGDGLGPMYNGVSCAACHFQGGLGGAGGAQQNVQLLTALPPKRQVANFRNKLVALHPLFASGFGTTSSVMLHRQSTTADYDHWRSKFSEDKRQSYARPVRKLRAGGLMFSVAERSSPPLFGAGLIDRLPAKVLEHAAAEQRRQSPEIAGRVPRAAFDVGRFGWRGQTASLRDFVSMACAVELGLEVAGHAQERDPLAPHERPPGFDLTTAQVDELTAFVASLPAPREQLPEAPARRLAAITGKQLFASVGCVSCHTENLGSIRGLYSDLLLHNLGAGLEGPAPPIPDSPGFAFARAGGGAPVQFASFARTFEQSFPHNFAGGQFNPGHFNPSRFVSSYLGAVNELFVTPGGTREWRTPPLWGVADSAPYLHDGRAADLRTAISLHDGQARNIRKRFERLSDNAQGDMLEFLGTLRAPQQ